MEVDSLHPIFHFRKTDPTMSNAITAFSSVPFSPAALAKPKKKAGKFPARLQFIATGQSKVVTSGQVKVGHWALVDGETTTDLGESINVIVLGRLDKAVNMTSDDVETHFAPSKGYDECVEAVEADGYNSGCMFGPVFLCFLCDTEQFVELFLNNKSGRLEGDNINGFLPISEAVAKEFECEARPARPATLGSKTASFKKGKKTIEYCVPTTDECVVALEVENPPTPEQLKEACDNFVKQAEVEEAGRDR